MVIPRSVKFSPYRQRIRATGQILSAGGLELAMSGFLFFGPGQSWLVVADLHPAHRGKALSHWSAAFVRRSVRDRTKFAAYDRRVGVKAIRKRDDLVPNKQETLTVWTIIVAVAFPMLLAAALVAMDMRSDLSELKSTGQVDDKGTAPVGWPDLERQHEGSGRVRMIGYMMDGYQPSRDGATVDMFVLLPEAGQFLHPAHGT